MKYVLIGLIMVQFSLQLGIGPENSELSYPQDVPKKYFKKDNDNMSKKHVDSFNVHREKKYKPEHEKKTSREENVKWKHNKKKRDEGNNLQIVTNSDNHNENPITMVKDTEVNSKLKIEHVNPDSELIKVKKIDFYKEMQRVDLSKPPNPNNTVLMARYIVHTVDWGAMATVTTRSGMKHGPFANIISISDGPIERSSGVPFFYMSPLDLSTKDLMKENKASLTATLAQTDFCRKEKLDPQSPVCARLILSGKVKRVKTGTSEEDFARSALFSRHPEMKTWPKDHEFYFSKLKISQIILLDHFGGPTYIDIEQYLHPVNLVSNDSS